MSSKIKIVRTTDQLKRVIRALSQQEVFAFDFETNDRGKKFKKDLRYYNPWEPGAKIVCMSLAWKPGEAIVVPLWHDESAWRKNWVKVLKAFKPAFERDVKIIAHNGKFDCKWAFQFGLYPELTFDTMLAAHILDENRYKGLKPLSEQYGFEQSSYALELIDTHTIPLKTLARYAGKDADYTFRLYEIFKAELNEQPRLKRVFTKIMMPSSNVLTRVELGGMYVHQEKLADQIEVATVKKEEARQELLGYVPEQKRESINFNSPPQIAKWLFGDLDLPVLDLTKTEAPSTNESVLLRLAAQHPGPNALLNYRHHKGNLEKLVSWETKQDHNHRVHTTYKLFGTVTGRLSSEKPNLQQVPREGAMRTVFGAPPGWVFVEADYSQVELRVAAMLAHDETLLRIFAMGGDPHMTTAAEASGLTEAQIRASDKSGKTEHRKRAKAINFGFLYGMGAKKFVEYARDNYGVDVTEAEAERFKRRYFGLYSKLTTWHNRQVRIAHRYKQVHNPIGRVRHLPDVDSSEQYLAAEAERQAINSPVQSMASDLMLIAMCRLDAEMRTTPTARVVGTIHDALAFEIKLDVVDSWLPRIRQVMEDIAYVEKTFGTQITVPLEVEIKVGDSWGGGVVVPA